MNKIIIIVWIRYLNNNDSMNNIIRDLNNNNNNMYKKIIIVWIRYLNNNDNSMNTIIRDVNNNNSMNNIRDLAREVKKLWNMNVMVIRIVISALGTVSKCLVRGMEELDIGGCVETIKSLLRCAILLRRILKNWGNLSFWLQYNTINLWHSNGMNKKEKL